MIQETGMWFNVLMKALANQGENAERVRITGEFRVLYILAKHSHGMGTPGGDARVDGMGRYRSVAACRDALHLTSGVAQRAYPFVCCPPPKHDADPCHCPTKPDTGERSGPPGS